MIRAFDVEAMSGPAERNTEEPASPESSNLLKLRREIVFPISSNKYLPLNAEIEKKHYPPERIENYLADE
jgi:hypothetical protein